MLVRNAFLLLTPFALSAVASLEDETQIPLGTMATIVTSCRNSRQVALTFDDGPYIYLRSISKTLKDNGAIGTFFFNGNNWACIYDSARAGDVKAIYDAGHQVASHTWAHKDLNTLTYDQVHDEFWRVELALLRITGAYPAMTRPPYGNHNANVDRVATDRQQAIIMWDLDSGDSTGSPASESKRRYDDAIARNVNNLLALNHETRASTANDVIPYAVKRLKAAGYQLVSVATCTGLPAYRYVTAPSPRNSSWVC